MLLNTLQCIGQMLQHRIIQPKMSMLPLLRNCFRVMEIGIEPCSACYFMSLGKWHHLSESAFSSEKKKKKNCHYKQTNKTPLSRVVVRDQLKSTEQSVEHIIGPTNENQGPDQSSIINKMAAESTRKTMSLKWKRRLTLLPISFYRKESKRDGERYKRIKQH